MGRARKPTEAELALWQHATRDAVPLAGPRPGAGPEVEGAEAAAPPSLPEALPARRPARVPRDRPCAALDPTRPVGLDRRSWLRLKRGQLAIEAILDLHGRSQADAHAALERFLAQAQADGRRTVLVVTGKGLESGGILRHMVPRWLNEGTSRARIVAYAPAQPRHGGAGALYVLIRRRRAAG